jgi:hypothetical protein
MEEGDEGEEEEEELDEDDESFEDIKATDDEIILNKSTSPLKAELWILK